jgi:UDP-N-acetyl-D-mannosaminuronic acid dehydrogenase
MNRGTIVALYPGAPPGGQNPGQRNKIMRPNKIAVVGPGTVGMPMAALLASAVASDGSPPPRVVVVQRPSASSGWKVKAINAGRSPLGGREPLLEKLIAESVARGTLSASHEYDVCGDADVILVCVQTDRIGLAPDYAALMGALADVATAINQNPDRGRPLVIIESAIAPSTMQTLVRPLFASRGLVDGKDILLANSPNRGMSGRLVESITRSDKLVGGLGTEAPVLAASLYRRILSRGRLVVTNSLAAETASAIETAFRDVRIAFSSEVARHCDRIGVDFRTLRDHVNDVLEWSDAVTWNPNAIPTGALLLPTVGVGGQALPRDGVLLWWRALEANQLSRNSLILAARSVNDASPATVVRKARLELGSFAGRRVTVLGAAYRAESAGTRNSPSLVLATLLRDTGADVVVHDPLVHMSDDHLMELNLADQFTPDLDEALFHGSIVFAATGHRAYQNLSPILRNRSSGIEGVVDACNLFHPSDFDGSGVQYTGIGQGRSAPNARLVRSVASMYRAVARGVANEVDALVRFLNARYSDGTFNTIDATEVRRLAATSWCECRLERPGDIRHVPEYDGFMSGLAQLAIDAAPQGTRLRQVPPEHVPPGIWFGNEQAVVAERETPWPLTPKQ